MKVGFFILILVVFLIANFYVFYRAWQGMPPNNVGQTILIALGVTVLASLILTFSIGDILPIGLNSVLYRIATSWLIILVFLVMAYLLKDMMGLLASSISFIPNDAVTRYTRDNWLGFGFMIGFITLLMLCGYMKYKWKVRVEQSIYTEKNIFSASSDSLAPQSLRIVAISDLHIGYNIGEKELMSWIDLINKENPDLVIIGGDIIDNSVRPLNAGYYADCFKKIKSKYGVYACLGNHEYISGVEPCIHFIKETGITLLRDSYVEIDSSFYIVGRDDRMSTQRKKLADVMQGIDKSKPIILLDHQPYNLKEAADNGVDFQFSGHTHSGQVFPMSLIVDKMYENSHGLSKKGNTQIYVSSGIGIWGGEIPYWYTIRICSCRFDKIQINLL